jgi:hypothetical protein
MKKLYTFLAVAVFCFASANVMAQSFIMPDTVKMNASGFVDVHATVNNLTASPFKLQWRVIGNNLPSTAASPGVCDNVGCYNMPDLWPSSATKLSNTYASGIMGDIKLSVDFTNVTPIGGCYYVKIRANQQGGGAADTAVTTFVACKIAPTVTTNVAVANVHNVNEVNLYPNPATNEINVVYDEAADIKSVAIYNLIGKLNNVYKVSGNSANLSIENLPSGIYFVRLMNTLGQTVVTRKFTKQ